MNLLAFLVLVQTLLLLLGGGLMLHLGQPPVSTLQPLRDGGIGLFLFFLLRGLEVLFARLCKRSFQTAEALHRALGKTLLQLGLGPKGALGLSLLSALAEEAFFRGGIQNLLLPHLGGVAVAMQALLFALLHPAPRSALAYPLYTGLAGLLFGLTYLFTGSLVPSILAHFLHNAKSFAELLREPE
ncbi:MAG: lysostaphin resistance A-like protein [Thermaceae bacterium]